MAFREINMPRSQPAAENAERFSAPKPDAPPPRGTTQPGIEYIDHPDFHRPNARRTILGLGRRRTTLAELHAASGTSSPSMSTSTDLLTKEDEIRLFRKMNFLKFLASTRSSRARRDGDRAAEIQRLLKEAESVRDQIIGANVRLVISIAKKYVNAANTFDELVSEGNLSLMQAVEKYDVARGNRFSTYATRAIRNNLYHYVLHQHRRRQRVVLGDDQRLLSAPDSSRHERLWEKQLDDIRRSLARIMNRLDDQKRRVIASRFGLPGQAAGEGTSGVGMTLKEIAQGMGVSRERVRQIENRAMRELRLYAAEAKVSLPEEW